MNNRIKNAILVNYLEEYSIEVGLKEVTIKGKKGTLLRFLKWLDHKSFNAKNCRAWTRELSKIGWKPISIKHEIRVIRATVKFLYDRKFLKENFASQVPYPKVPKKLLDIVPVETAEKIIIAGTTPGTGDGQLYYPESVNSFLDAATNYVLATNTLNNRVEAYSNTATALTFQANFGSP